MVHEQLTDGPYCADDPLPSPKVPDAVVSVTDPEQGPVGAGMGEGPGTGTEAGGVGFSNSELDVE